MRRVTTILAVVALVVLAGCGGGSVSVTPGSGDVGGGEAMGASGSGGVGDGGDGGGQVGAAVGGAQDANAFRRNIENGYVPQPTDLTYEGLYHDYYFDTGNATCDRRFCPRYATAVTRDPISNETERFVSVGLTSGLTREDIQRKPLDLVVVVDTSGSMKHPFDQYEGSTDGGGEQAASKLSVATEAVRSMLGNLGADDRVAVVGFDDDATVHQDLRRVENTDVAALRADLGTLTADQGTDLDAGMMAAREVLSGTDASGRQQRIIYLTDAMPNQGNTSGPALEQRVASFADEGIHTTVIGVGVDFNSEFTRQVATVEGANYYTVDSPAAFDRRMDEAFSYMVTPLAHDLTLRAVGDGAEIERVYGAAQGEGQQAQLLHVSTLFPSRREGNRSEGGVILLEIEGEADAQVRLVASYEDPDGDTHEVVRNVSFDREPPYYGSSGIRKAVVLTEYATLLRNWMVHERGGDVGQPGETASIEYREYADSWETEPVDLRVTDPYDDRIARFLPYFRRHARALDTERMQQDLRILETLVDRTSPETARPTDPTATPEREAAPTSDDRTTVATTTGRTSAGLLGRTGTLVGLVNLGLTVLVGAYGIRQKRRSRNQGGGR